MVSWGGLDMTAAELREVQLRLRAESSAQPAWRVRDAQRKRARRAAGEVLRGDVRVSYFKAREAMAYALMLHGLDPVLGYRLAEEGLTDALPERLRRWRDEREAA